MVKSVKADPVQALGFVQTLPERNVARRWR
jgi:hypothetical protein